MTSITKQSLIELLNKATSLLSIDPQKAIRIIHPYVPANGPVSIDYGIYSLQYALIFGENIQATKANENKSMPVKIGKLFEKCKSGNLTEYLKMLAWATKELKQVHEQIKRARVSMHIDSVLHESLSNLSSLNPSEVEELVLSLEITNPRHHLLANSYKDMYEISFFLELMANLLNISAGGKFSDTPFKGLIINGNPILDRGRLIKGNAISWIEENSDSFLREIVTHSYNNVLRNLLGGHNDYVFDSTAEIYASKNGKVKFDYGRVLAYLSNLELVFQALRLEALTRFYEDTKLPAKISEIGYIYWYFTKNKDKIIIAQYWSNFSKRDKSILPKTLSFYRLPMKREGKFISLGFDKKYIFPYDLRVIANNQSLDLMKSLLGKDKINITILSVAPVVSPFTQMSKTIIPLGSNKFLVVGDMEAEVEIDKPSLETLINYLEN